MATGVTGRIAAAWASPGASWAREWEEASEARLLAYAFGTCIFLVLGQIGAEIIRPTAAIGDDRQAWFAAQVFAGLSFFPLSLYASAALMRLIARGFGGSGSWRQTRLALFWSGFASGPLAAMTLVVGATFAAGDIARPLAGLAWAGLLAPMLAAAHGFRPSRVAAVFILLAAGAFMLPLLG